jgi:hypothetical protein
MARTPHCLHSEAQFVSLLLVALGRGDSPLGELQTTTEWDYKTGRADVLARSACGALIALEAKLTDWRRACRQAYRTTAFVKFAYIVVPKSIAEKACAHEQYFAQYGIGLCSFDGIRLDVLIEASAEDEPLGWLTNRAHSTFDELAKISNGSGKRRRSRLQTA